MGVTDEKVKQLVHNIEDTTYENAVNEEPREIHRMVETVKKDSEVGGRRIQIGEELIKMSEENAKQAEENAKLTEEITKLKEELAQKNALLKMAED